MITATDLLTPSSTAIDLPAPPPSGTRRYPSEESRLALTTLHGAHVLIVDRDARVRAAMGQMFGVLGAHVHTAMSPVDGLMSYYELFRQNTLPRLIVADWWMVPRNGPVWGFLDRAGVLEEDASLARMVRNVFKMDDNAFVAFYTDDVADVVAFRERNPYLKDAIIASKDVPLTDFIGMLLEHQGLIDQAARGALDRRMRRAETESGYHRRAVLPL